MFALRTSVPSMLRTSVRTNRHLATFSISLRETGFLPANIGLRAESLPETRFLKLVPEFRTTNNLIQSDRTRDCSSQKQQFKAEQILAVAARIKGESPVAATLFPNFLLQHLPLQFPTRPIKFDRPDRASYQNS